ncbi:cytochrome P450 [Nocardia sp. NBC_00565]|uniref:cytochrome P450 n=1 Tax=Nocardia sp. NBC_00565 TaxID=2975993 RepID=UPI002E822A07|nr:cytochrome P450 [Nocardia sp. NBC_00565]WUC03428.1 cytochrome P450 [Nocardia sp. NBC_00565]
MYDPNFAADPHSAYAEMRHRYHPSLVPVDLAPHVPATLVISHATAVRILNDPEHFPSDPREWQVTVPADTPVLAMMAWFPAARYNTGAAHDRYRSASVASIDGVDTNNINALVEDIAIPLINKFCGKGAADLMADYAFGLVLEVLNRICGCPAEIGKQVATGMAARFDQRSTLTAQQGMTMIKDALMELIQLKRANPEPEKDATSRLVIHPSALDDVEVFAQLMSFYGAGFELERNLITNTLELMLRDPRYGAFGGDYGRNLSTVTALDEVLFNDPPMANFCFRYPKQPIMVDSMWLDANQPVVVSLAACNNDPAIRVAVDPGGSHIGNRAHVAFGGGPHACPAKPLAYEIAQHGIDQLFAAVPDMTPAVPVEQLEWRPGPFHRALKEFPVVFDKLPPMRVR